ncbi:MAG: glycosyltransferase family 4 protein [Geminicoccaceae bacterium]
MADTLHWIVPGSLHQRTGGYIYDRRIVEGLITLGRPVQVHELAGRFPEANDEAIEAAGVAVDNIGQDMAVIDGLALPAFVDHIDRLSGEWIGLIHHPLSMETGLSVAEIKQIAAIEGPLMRRATRLVVTSPGTCRDLAGFDIDPGGVAVVLPGVEPARLARGSGGERPRELLTVGSLTRRKGHLTLLEALSRLLDLDWNLNLVGSAAWDPEYAAGIGKTVTDLGLSKRVALVGEQDEDGLDAFYDGADLFVLASHHEGYGMVLTEALAHGLPIISTTAGAIPETVPAAAGRLVAPGDAEALAGALRQVLTDGDLYHRLEAGASGARATLSSWSEAAQRFAMIIDRAASAEVIAR